jgi:DNA-binding transcriptional LysR family regulator
VLPAVLGAYRETHPAVALTLLERLPAQQLAWLRAGDLDVGIGPPPPNERGLETELLSEERIVLALPAAHPLARRDVIDVADLAEEPWLLVNARTPSRLRDTAVAACAAAGFTPRVAQEARQLDALVALVSAGLGVTLVPDTAERMPRAGVAVRPLRGVDRPFRLVAVWRHGDAAPAVRSFLDVMRAVAARRGA